MRIDKRSNYFTQRFRLQIGNLKRQFAIENPIFNRFRSALVDSRNRLRLPPIRCELVQVKPGEILDTG